MGMTYSSRLSLATGSRRLEHATHCIVKNIMLVNIILSDIAGSNCKISTPKLSDSLGGATGGN